VRLLEQTKHSKARRSKENFATTNKQWNQDQ
jgi:hypothetical protein